MSLKASLPGVRDPIVGQGGVASRPIYTFFQAIATTVDALSTASGNVTIPDLPISENANVVGASGFSIYAQGTLKTGIVRILLDGDTQTPGNTQYYGSGPTGTRGWFSVSDALDSTDNLTLTIGADGVTTLDLADLANSGTGSALVKITRDSKGRIAGTSAATTTDLAEGANLYYTDARADARITAQKGLPNGLASLDASGKLDTGQLPALAITETFVIADEASMLALTAQQGDVAVRTDLNKSLILTADPASTLSNWQELLAPTGTVTSFNGRTGSVVPATGDYTPAQVGAEPTVTAGTIGDYWRGDKTWRDFATDVRVAVLTGLSTATSAVISATDTVLSAFGKLQAQVSLKMDDAAPAALAESSAAQSIPTGTFQKVLLASEVYDSGFYNPATSRFTPTKAGKYVAIGTVSFTPAVASGLRVIAAATKNGNIAGNVTASTHNQVTNTVQHTAVYDMNGTTDYLELYARQDSGGSMSITGVNNTYMVVYRISA